MPTDFENTEYFQLLSEHSQTWHLGGAAATELLLSRIETPQAMSVLEIGCGSGKTTQQLMDRGVRQILALDHSAQVLRWASVSVQRSMTKILFIHADAHHIPAADNSFDVVLIESVLIFCDSAAGMAEVHRVLKPGGMLLLNELVVLNEIILDHVDKIDAFIGSPVLTLRTQAGWRTEFQNAGFEVVWESLGKLPRLRLFIFLQTLDLLDAVSDHEVLSYQLFQLAPNAIS